MERKQSQEVNLLYGISQILGMTTELEEGLTAVLKLLSARMGMKGEPLLCFRKIRERLR